MCKHPASRKKWGPTLPIWHYFKLIYHEHSNNICKWLALHSNTCHVFQYQTKGELKDNQDVHVMKHQKFIKYNKDPIVEYCWISNAMKIQ